MGSVYTRVVAVILVSYGASLQAADPRTSERIARVASWLNPIDQKTSAHELEKRGFVEAPIDYSHPEDAKLQIGYRILPVLKIANGKSEYLKLESAEAKQKPFLLLINGGPGASSEHLRKLSFAYDGSLPKATDRLAVLTQHFRVVLVDQRGTAGRSSALDFEIPGIDGQMVTDYFGPRPVALDHASVIRAVNPANDSFYIWAQSYGGLVGANYLVEMERDSTIPRPQATALTSPGFQTAENAFQRQVDRRRRQHDLALELQADLPGIAIKMIRLRERIESVDPNSTVFDSLAITLGRPNWKVEFVKKVAALLEMTDDELRAEIKGDYATIEPLNHVLSSAIVTPGYTDRTLYHVANRIVPLQSWMPDELRMYWRGRGESPTQEAFLLQVDHKPPQASNMAAHSEMRDAISKSKVVFSGSWDDPLIPFAIAQQNYQDLAGGATTRFFEFQNGGHIAAFMSPNCEALLRHGFGLKLE